MKKDAIDLRILLVGLPGAGKTTVGQLLAGELELRLHDIDEAIERSENTTIREIISTRGEKEFRRLEREETERALSGPPAIIVPGAGWAAFGNNLKSIGRRALSVYLKVPPSLATERVENNNDRPLLDSSRPLQRMTELFNARRRFYEACDTSVSTEGKTAEAVASEIAELARGATAG